MKYILSILLFAFWQLSFANTIATQTALELNAAFKTSQPGDTIVMKNGVWRDLEIKFYSNGTKEKPVVLKAEEFGSVFIEGESFLELWGDYLVVDGLVFRNGHSPKSSVITFKKSSKQVATNCRVTNCAIDGFSNTNRFERNYWIAFYGKNNRLDHCYIGGKLNYGSTISVWLGNELSRENKHRIDHNFFGHRPRLGSNGGETIRIGSSKNSMSSSNTVIEDNYFEHCNGETEIVSIKSCDNIVQGNTFYECEGSVVLRHGKRNVVRNNAFIGNKLPYTGGVRVIGDDHLVYNNFFQGLRGKEFRAPLVLMNGIPNSPLNRYFQVQNVKIVGNVWSDCDVAWVFGMGIKNEYETLPPENVLIACNTIHNSNSENGLIFLDDMSGVEFEDNLVVNSQDSDFGKLAGFHKGADNYQVLNNCFKKHLDDSNADAIITFNGEQELGFNIPSNASANNCGPNGYEVSKSISYPPYTVNVSSGVGTIDKAIEEAKPGAILVLESGEYVLTSRIKISHPIKICADDKDDLPVLKQHSTDNTKIFFEINYGGELELEGLIFDGEAGSASPTKYAITTARENMAKTFNLKAKDCVFRSFGAVNEGGAVVKAYKGSLADSVVFESCKFVDLYRGFDLDEEIDDKGIYNAENMILVNCLFKNIEEYSISFYRGGNDESTVGPHLNIDHCVFDNVNNTAEASMLKLVGIQRVSITNCIFSNSPEVNYVVELYGKYNVMSHCNIFASGKIGVAQGAVIGDGMMYNNPMFDQNNFLKDYSLLKGKAKDGNDIGLTKQ